jgi:hypothetical protein
VTSEAVRLYDARRSAAPLILKHACRFFAKVCDELERADQEDNEYCLLLSNGADDLESFISGMERLHEART